MTQHTTRFEDMSLVQRSLHNLTCIMDDDDCIATYKGAVSAAIDGLTAIRQERNALEQQRDELLAALEKYGSHINNCKKTWICRERQLDCSCGLDEAIAKAGVECGSKEMIAWMKEVERIKQQRDELLADIKKVVWHCHDNPPFTAERMLREAIAKAGAK